MAKKIIILSDGTGNAASSVWRTNVWRIFQSLKLDSQEQAARYDDGVGTSSFKPFAVLGGAFGWGLKRNVLESYKFVCRNYEYGNLETGEGCTKLYLIGFSRGAFTVRVLSALILQQGLVRVQSDAELHDLARKAYRTYRAKGYTSRLRLEKPARLVRDAVVYVFDKLFKRPIYVQTKNIVPPTIEFIGVWDTVAAYGLPADEMTRGISDWIWPLELPNRILSDRVHRARHALALDDERTTFHPVLWTEDDPKTLENKATLSLGQPYNIVQERLVQVWFTGMHANVGGGYPDDALAFTPLYWLMREARAAGLVFKDGAEADPDTDKWMKAGRDPDGRIYDSRIGLGGYYRYGPRRVVELCDDPRNRVKIERPKIHESVFARIEAGCNSYAPIGLPQDYVVVMDDGTVLPMHGQPPDKRLTLETQTGAKNRAAAQDRLWNYVWWRRIVYFATLAATFNLVLFPNIYEKKSGREFDNSIRWVSEMLRALQALLPDWSKRWIDHFAANPVTFVVGFLILVVLVLYGAYLSGKIKDNMRAVWSAKGATSDVASSRFHLRLQGFRTSAGYRRLIAAFKFWILPATFAIVVLLLGVTGVSHFAFHVMDSFGAYCRPTPNAEKVDKGVPQAALSIFETRSICAPTGLIVREGFRYEILIEVTEPWLDHRTATTPVGYLSGTRSFFRAWALRSAVLLRRVIARPWFRGIARVGPKGVDEYFLDPVRVAGRPNVWRDDFKARRGGEVFLYVNDAVVAVPGLGDLFYRNNHGKAKVSIRLCPSASCR